MNHNQFETLGRSSVSVMYNTDRYKSNKKPKLSFRGC